MLRDYQKRSVEQLYAWFEKNKDGNPCLDLPTGSGKSWIIAALCKDALTNWPETRILMLTHVKELVEQNSEKLKTAWPGAPMGICCASMNQKVTYEPITFGSMQTVRNRVDDIGWVDLMIVDECHLLNNNNEGTYRKIAERLKEVNPGLRIVGLTATPWRLGQGNLTEGDEALFSDIIDPVTIEELIYKGYLAKLSSKATNHKLSTEGVHKRGGEYIEKELNAAVDNTYSNETAVQETIERAGGRKAWLFFCSGVQHAHNIRDMLQSYNISAECVTGDTPKGERERIIGDFKAGRITALTNANVLTTGFDYPDIDLIAMLRPTMSPVLYVQMVGRGMRPKSHINHCMVLDFASNIDTHGPITAVSAPGKKKGEGEAPIKVCPECDEIVALGARYCPNEECGHEFVSEDKTKNWSLSNEDIMGMEDQGMNVTEWKWRKHVSQNSGKEMVKVTYYGILSDKPVTEYLTILHPGYAGQKAMEALRSISQSSGVKLADADDIDSLCYVLNKSEPPQSIHFRKDGKFVRVTHRVWEHENVEAKRA